MLLAALALTATAFATSAHAIVFTLNDDHCTGTCGTGPFGTATITQGATGVDFNIALANSVFHLSGGSGGLSTVNFGFTGQTFLATDLVINSFNGPATTWALVQPNPNQDGFGDFLQGINGDAVANGVNSGGTLLNFTITGALLANLAFSQNGGASTQIAVDILGLNGNTGLVGGTPGNPPPPPPAAVPLPGAVWLFSAGLGGLFMLTRRKKKAAVKA